MAFFDSIGIFTNSFTGGFTDYSAPQMGLSWTDFSVMDTSFTFFNNSGFTNTVWDNAFPSLSWDSAGYGYGWDNYNMGNVSSRGSSGGSVRRNTPFRVSGKNLTEYTNNNKAANSGKLSGLNGLNDNTGMLAMCAPEVVDTVVELAREAEKRGYRIEISSSFRTYQQQQAIQRTRGTYGRGGYAAAPGNSPHEFGQAIDFKLYKGNTEVTPSKGATPWLLDVLSKRGMRWGGNFSTAEPWHFDTGKTSEVKRLLA